MSLSLGRPLVPLMSLSLGRSRMEVIHEEGRGDDATSSKREKGPKKRKPKLGSIVEEVVPLESSLATPNNPPASPNNHRELHCGRCCSSFLPCQSKHPLISSQ